MRIAARAISRAVLLVGVGMGGDIIALLARMNRGGTETLIVPSEYLEVIVTKH